MAPARAVQLAVRGAVIAVLAIPWLLASAMFLTGVVLWLDWRALAREGVDAWGVVETCRWEATEGSKTILRSRRGFYSCDYGYRLGGSTEVYPGHFQSPREWRAGERIQIRYRRDRPAASATLQNLEHPGVLPGALIVLPLAFAAWHFRGPLQRLLRPQPARRGPPA